MSISTLVRATFLGHVADKQAILSDLQALGCLHLIPLTEQGDAAPDSGPSAQARDALKFLLSCPQKHRQVKDPSKLDAFEIEKKALEVQRRLRVLEEERDFLVKRIDDLKAWGDFRFPPVDELNGFRLWFFIVPHYEMPKVAATNLLWEVVHRDNRFVYVVVVSEREPEGMPVPRTRTGSRPRHELESRLEDVELEIEDAQAERFTLTRWCLLLARSLDDLEDRAALDAAATGTYEDDPVFALQAWAPETNLGELESYASEHGLVLDVQAPDPAETPPTLLQNSRFMSTGQDLVTFYMTPGYWTWDPSSIVFVSFAIFFAMIFSDAGYAAVLGLLVFSWRKRLGQTETGRRLQVLFAVLVGATIAYGALVGSYFGVTPPSDSVLGKLNILDVNDTQTMMALSVVIGVAHVVLGNVMDARRLGWKPEAFAPVGWACFVAGGLVLAAGMQADAGSVQSGGTILMILAVVLIVFFTEPRASLFKRILGGVLGLTSITKAFGDVLSYLRLFALGLATASLAVAFNGMASDIREAFPGVGLFFALLVLLIGHGVNFTLGLMSGFIHGLRLNFIEFFNWSLKDEGNLYRPFKRKEGVHWNPSS